MPTRQTVDVKAARANSGNQNEAEKAQERAARNEQALADGGGRLGWVEPRSSR
jgi:hypothetical protein